MAEAVVEGAKGEPGADAQMRRVPETLPTHVLEKMGAREVQESLAHVPFCGVEALADADAEDCNKQYHAGFAGVSVNISC